ncbi:helicase associated domain-containing protein [Virgisporangium aurantiacum]|uniref:helicase associated domain-containing protein n=1 Tax=Virgisporangium aurantiacum TaxID=175570 RepID=UPI003570C82D
MNLACGLATASAFHDREGHPDVPMCRRVNGFSLHGGLDECRSLRRKGRLPADVITMLDALGMNWDNHPPEHTRPSQ